MNYVLDALILLIMVFSVIGGFKYGLIRSIFRSCGFIIAILLALIFTRFISPAIEERYIYNKVYEKVESAIENDEVGENISDTVESIRKNADGIKKLLIGFGIDSDSALDSVEESADNENNDVKISLTIKTAELISSVVSSVITFAALFIIFFLLLLLIFTVAGGIVRQSPLKVFDTALGGAFGLAMGYLKACVFVILIANVFMAVLIFCNSSDWFANAVDNTFIMKFLIQHNLITAVIG